MIRLTVVLVITFIVSSSCNRQIYSYDSDKERESIRLNNDGTFVFKTLDKYEKRKFKINGIYKINEDNIVFTFNPVANQKLKYLPINEGELNVSNYLDSISSYKFNYKVKLLEPDFKFPIWGGLVEANLRNGETLENISNSYGEVTFNTNEAIQSFTIKADNSIPTIIYLNEINNATIEVLWAPKSGRYQRGHMIQDRGPIKKMLLVKDDENKTIEIFQNDLDKKKFIRN